MTTDATPAYRGYRRQHLYTLYRILETSDQEGIVFHLEGQADLDILALAHFPCSAIVSIYQATKTERQ